MFRARKCLDKGVELCNFLLSTPLEATFRTVNDVIQITEFSNNFTFWWEIIARKLLLSIEASNAVYFFYLRTVGAFAQSCTYWYLAPGSQRFLHGRYLILADVNLSLRFGSLLKPMIVFSGKIFDLILPCFR